MINNESNDNSIIIFKIITANINDNNNNNNNNSNNNNNRSLFEIN